MSWLTRDTDALALDEYDVRARFDGVSGGSVGLEEEVLFVDPETLLPVPAADAIVTAAADARIKRELAACQGELITAPRSDPRDAVTELGRRRSQLLHVCGDEVRPMAAAVHPTAPPATALAHTQRYVELAQEYGEVAQRQLVGALQVHVAVGSADGTLAVYNALRGYLPDLAALAASAPFYEGRDTGLASIRPLVAGQLPRQGIPPAIRSWSDFVEDLQWGARSGTVLEPRRWWWELRPHVHHGTIEVRVPDAQASLDAVLGVVLAVHALVTHLADQHRSGRDLPVPETWRIAENRWIALRDGVNGSLCDLWTGERRSTRQRLHDLLTTIEPRSVDGLDPARRLVERNGAEHLRAAGVDGAAAWLTESFAT